MMSATANTYKLNDYFNTWYGPPLNMYVNPFQINVTKNFNHKIIEHNLDDLYGFIPSVSINYLKFYHYIFYFIYTS